MSEINIHFRVNDKIVSSRSIQIVHPENSVIKDVPIDIDKIFSYSQDFLEANYRFLPLSVKMLFNLDIDSKKKCVYIDSLHYSKEDKTTKLLLEIIIEYFSRATKCVASGIGAVKNVYYLFSGIEDDKILAAYIPPYAVPANEFYDKYLKLTGSVNVLKFQKDWAFKLNTAHADIFHTVDRQFIQKLDAFNANIKLIPFRAFEILIDDYKVDENHPFYISCNNAVTDAVSEFYDIVFKRGYLQKPNVNTGVDEDDDDD